MQNLALVGIAALFLTGCPEGEGGSRLVGTWDELVSPISNDSPGSATFRGDGTYEVIEDEIETGTFEEAGDTLILTKDSGSVQELPYAIDGQRFTPIGFRRAAADTGFAGEWRAEGTSDGEPQVMRLVLQTDSSFELHIGEDAPVTGIWRDDDGELVTTLQFQDDNGDLMGFDLPWHSIDDAVSMFAYERR
jgi:hypothetical protein